MSSKQFAWQFFQAIFAGFLGLCIALLIINLINGYFQRQCRERFLEDYSYGGGRNHFCVNSEGNLKLLNKKICQVLQNYKRL